MHISENNSDQVYHELINIFASVGIFLDASSHNEELVLDSLQFVSIIIAIEENLMVPISNDFDYSKLRTFNDFYHAVTGICNRVNEG